MAIPEVRGINRKGETEVTAPQVAVGKRIRVEKGQGVCGRQGVRIADLKSGMEASLYLEVDDGRLWISEIDAVK